MLRYWRDLSVDEIADRLQIPAGTVKSRLHYALKSLRSALEEATSRPAGGVRSGPLVGRRPLLFAARIAAAAAILAIAVSGLYLYGRNRGTSPIAPPSGLESAVPSGSAASSPSGETSPVPSTLPGPATSPATAGWRQVDGVFPKTAANPDSVIPNPVFARWDGGFLAFVGGKIRHPEFRQGPPPAWAHTTPAED